MLVVLLGSLGMLVELLLLDAGILVGSLIPLLLGSRGLAEQSPLG